MKKAHLFIIGILFSVFTGEVFAENGCVIRLTQDETCDSSYRINSGLDPEINGCANPSSNYSEISGLYCRSPYPCFRDYPSSYQVGSDTISWYNCYFGAATIPPVTGPEILVEHQSKGCVVKDVPDLNCPTGHRLYSQLDSRLNACTDSVSDNAEIEGAFCKSSLKCFKDFRSVYRDNGTVYSWYNCQDGAFPIYGP